MDASQIVERLRSGDPLAVARAITAIENETAFGTAISAALGPRAGRSRTIGVTGPPGAGKSSLINALIQNFLTRHRRIGVLTVDPSSPVTGGAVLADRVRMAAHSRNPNVFIRSLAARGHLGGVTRMTGAVMDVLDAAGMDLVIVETVGTGQSEVEIASLAQVKLVICPPGLGDDIQAIKAGVLEIADFLVVNKADLPDADRTAMQLKAMLHHRGDAETRNVLLTSTVSGSGVTELVGAIEARFNDSGASSAFKGNRREALADYAATIVRGFVRDAQDRRLEEISQAVASGRTTYRDGVRHALRLLLESDEQK